MTHFYIWNNDGIWVTLVIVMLYRNGETNAQAGDGGESHPMPEAVSSANDNDRYSTIVCPPHADPAAGSVNDDNHYQRISDDRVPECPAPYENIRSSLS